jgi:hypothetical protein
VRAGLEETQLSVDNALLADDVIAPFFLRRTAEFERVPIYGWKLD